MPAYLMDCATVIAQELEQPKVTRKSVGLTYAMAMRSYAAGVEKPDWKAINGAILAKWGMKGLETVKNRAWRLCEGKEQP